MLYIWILSNKFDLKQSIRVLHNTKCKQFFDVDINEYLDILKGLGAQLVIWTFYDQVVVKVEKGWVEQEFVLLIIATLPSEAGLPNE